MARKKKRRLKRKYRILRGIYAAIVAVAAVIVIGYGVYKVAVPAPAQAPVASTTDQAQENVPGMETGDHTRREQVYTFLLACPDQVSGNADAIMLLTYDVPNQKVGMLSVPRDTLVDESFPKINSSLHGGMENLQSVVSELVGYPIDFYISIDLDGFVELVDAVGGVEFNVPVEMYYNDPSQDLNIFFQPGMQHLDGQEAMEVCRFRKNADGTGYPMGDIQRSETVRNLMITVAKKLVANIGKLDQFVDILQRNVETNLSGTDLTWFVTKAIGIQLQNRLIRSREERDCPIRPDPLFCELHIENGWSKLFVDTYVIKAIICAVIQPAVSAPIFIPFVEDAVTIDGMIALLIEAFDQILPQ